MEPSNSLFIDLRFCEIHHDMWALGKFIDVVEAQIPHIGLQEVERTTNFLRANGLEEDEGEIDLAFQDVHHIVDNVVPRFFRGQLLVTLWSIYEAAIDEILENMRTEKGETKEIRDMKGNSKFARTDRYFAEVLGCPLYTSIEARERLKLLLLLRNVLAVKSVLKFPNSPDENSPLLAPNRGG